MSCATTSRTETYTAGGRTHRDLPTWRTDVQTSSGPDGEPDSTVARESTEYRSFETSRLWRREPDHGGGRPTDVLLPWSLPQFGVGGGAQGRDKTNPPRPVCGSIIIFPSKVHGNCNRGREGCRRDFRSTRRSTVPTPFQDTKGSG